MLYTLKDRLVLFIKSFIICFAGGLLLESIFTYSEVNSLRTFSIALGLSIGVAFNDILRYMFVKVKPTQEISTYCYLSVFMGIIGLPSFPLIIPSLMGIYYGLPGLKTSKRRIALTGIILSSTGLLLGVVFYVSCLYARINRGS